MQNDKEQQVQDYKSAVEWEVNKEVEKHKAFSRNPKQQSSLKKEEMKVSCVGEGRRGGLRPGWAGLEHHTKEFELYSAGNREWCDIEVHTQNSRT